MPAPSPTLVFRYRDLVAPTLEAHRRVLAQHGRCWWGWWKRPLEPDRADVWSELGAEVATGRVRVALFDAGTHRVHAAWIDQVIPPERGNADALRPLPVPDPELVPDYYRNSPFSRAWMRLVEIEPEPLDFFGRFAFGELPPLANYAQVVLDQLRGKPILTGVELSLMDTTIWRVTPYRGAERHDTVLAPPSTVAEPVSVQPVRARGDAILHLSDPHWATGRFRAQHVWRLESEPNDGRDTLSDAVFKAVQRAGRRVGMVLVTGDLTYTGAREEFDEAFLGLSRLLGNLELARDWLVVVPGNHDIRWSTDEKYADGAPVAVAPAAATAGYAAFYRRLFEHEPNVHLSMGRRYVFPHGGLVEVAGVNSSSLEQGRDFLAGMGRVQEPAFAQLANALGWGDGATLALRVLALHHHLTPTENLERAEEFARGFGMAIDAPRIQRMAARVGVQLAVHGHKHRVFVWRSGVCELPEETQDRWDLGELAIVGGGSAGSADTDGGRNYFNLIRVASEGVRLDMFRARSGSFDPMAAWSADFAIAQSPSRLVLGPWRKL